jgi:hypothetical protein
LNLSLDFSLDLQLNSDGTKVHCKSLSWEAEDLAKALGQEFVDTFSLQMEGDLAVEERVTKVRSLSIRYLYSHNDTTAANIYRVCAVHVNVETCGATAFVVLQALYGLLEHSCCNDSMV